MSMDLAIGNKTVKDFKTQMNKEMSTSQEDTITTQAIEATHEGLQNDK